MRNTYQLKLGVACLFLALICVYVFPNHALAASIPIPTSASEQADQIAVVVVRGDTLEMVQQAKDLIKNAGGKILIYLPPNVLHVKITQEDATALKKSDENNQKLIELISYDSNIPTTSISNAKTRAALSTSSRASAIRRSQPVKKDYLLNSVEPLLNDLRVNPNLLKTKEERKAAQTEYLKYWNANKEKIRKEFLQKAGLKYGETETTTNDSTGSLSQDTQNNSSQPSSDNTTTRGRTKPRSARRIVSSEPSTPAPASTPASTPVQTNTPPALEAPSTTYGEPGYDETSLFMSGEVAVDVFFEAGSFGNWTQDEIDAVKAQTLEALKGFTLDNPNADLSFIINFQSPNSAPFSCDSGGYSSGIYYANNLRNSLNADWGYSVIINYDNGRAYTYLFGPCIQLYSEDLRGGYVVRHESCHEFGALDNYYEAAQSPTATSGYLNVVNANSQYGDGSGYFGGAGENQSDMMVSSDVLGVYTRGQVGWLDEDGDGIIDLRDTFPYIEFQTTFSGPVSNPVALSGTAYEMPVKSEFVSDYGFGFNDVTINHVSKVEYRLNGKTWVDVPATDGAYNDRQEPFTITLPPLPAGQYTLEARATNSVGNTQAVFGKIAFMVSSSGNTVTNVAPFADFSITPPETRINFTVTLNAGSSSDLNEGVNTLQVQWDVNNDGTADTGWLPANQSYSTSYATAGQKSIKMTLRDTAGATASVIKTVNIVNYNLPPVARFSISKPREHGNTSGRVSLTLDASESYDPEDENDLRIRWLIGEGGNWSSWFSFTTDSVINVDNLSISQNRSSHVWMGLQVQDKDGISTTAYREFSSIPYNHPPELDFDAAISGNQLTITPTKIDDADYDTSWDGYLAARFDYESDGVWDTNFTSVWPSGLNPFTYTLPAGVEATQVTMQIRDLFWATKTVSKLATIPNYNQSPVITAIADKTVEQHKTVSFAVEATDSDGDVINLSASTSGAPVSSVGATFVDNGNGTGMFSWKADQYAPGTEIIFSFTATDVKGDSDTKNVKVTVTYQYITWDPATFQNVVVEEGNVLKKTSDNYWNGGALSVETITGNGGVEFVADGNSAFRMCGLDYKNKLSPSEPNNEDPHYSSIDYAAYLLGEQGLFICQRGSCTENAVASYKDKDKISVERIGKRIVYRVNDTVVYSSDAPDEGDLIVDAALFTLRATIKEARIMAGSSITVPGTITGLGAESGNSQVKLNWTKPVENGSPIIKYAIKYGIVNTAGLANYTNTRTILKGASAADDAIIADTTPEVTITGLTNGVKYRFAVTAENIAGPGNEATVDAVTAGKPGKVTGVNVQAGNRSVSLNWAAAAANGSDILRYKVEYDLYTEDMNPSQDQSFSTIETSGPIREVTIPNLNKGVRYWFRVKAVNAAGDGEASDWILATPLGTPSRVNGLSPTAGNAQVTLKWVTPASNGSNITSYKIRYGTSAEASTIIDTQTPVLEYTIQNLTNGVEYLFWAKAVNTLGDGDESSPEVRATPNNDDITVPGRVTGLTAEEGNGQVRLRWDSPEDNGGSANLTYKIEYGTGSINDPSFETVIDANVDGDFSLVITNLVNGTEYWFRINATNAAGDGEKSLEIFAIPGGLPDQVTGLSIEKGDGEVTLSWTEPNDNGSDIINYQIDYSTVALLGTDGNPGPSEDVSTIIVEGDMLSTIISQLSNGNIYWFHVRAINSRGEGPWSEWVSTILGDKPGRVSGVNAQASSGQVAVSWAAPDYNGGLEITNYKVEYDVNPNPFQDDTFLSVTVNGSTLSATIQPLTNGTQYWFRVRAINDMGAGDPSYPLVSATPMTTVPDAVRNLTPVPGHGHVTLNWAAPLNNGGLPVLKYILEFAAGAESNAGFQTVETIDATTLELTLPRLTNGVEYWFRAFAVNENGRSAAAVVKATPQTVKHNITWNKITGAKVEDTSLIKNVAAGMGNSGASSTQRLWDDGGIEFTITQSMVSLQFGLAYKDTDLNTTNIDYGVRMVDGNYLAVIERQTGWHRVVSDAWTYKVNDVITIERVLDKIICKKNGVAFYTSEVLSRGPMLADVSLDSMAATVKDAKIFGNLKGHPDVPSVVLDLRGAVDAGKVTLSWTALTTPEANGSAVTGYKVEYGADEFNKSKIISPVSPAYIPAYEFEEGVEYQFRILGQNALGLGPESNAVDLTTIVGPTPTPTPGPPPAPYCGDGIKNGTEECDRAAQNSFRFDCKTYPPTLGQFDSGELTCGRTCKISTENCHAIPLPPPPPTPTPKPTPTPAPPPAPFCGDGVRNGSEECDPLGQNSFRFNCKDYPAAGGIYDSGELSCGKDCKISTADCHLKSVCGKNGCESDETCSSCPADCGVCVVCGDGDITGDEKCDGSNLNNQTCFSLGYYRYSLDSLSCSADCKSFDESNCAYCGDGIVQGRSIPGSNGTEECDGNVPDGQTCESYGLENGELKCSGCRIDTSDCIQPPMPSPTPDAGYGSY